MAQPDTKPVIEAVIFDCFGVLYVDAHESFAAEYPQVADELHDINRQSDYGMLTRTDYVEAVSRLTGETPTAVEQFVHGEHRLNAALVRLLQKELRPHYKIGLLSNIGQGWITDFFDTHQLHDLFDAVVLSGNEGITKPHPRIYEIASQRLGVAAERCLFIDDLEENCAGADAVGMRTIRYRDFAQLKRDLNLYL